MLYLLALISIFVLSTHGNKIICDDTYSCAGFNQDELSCDANENCKIECSGAYSCKELVIYTPTFDSMDNIFQYTFELICSGKYSCYGVQIQGNYLKSLNIECTDFWSCAYMQVNASTSQKVTVTTDDEGYYSSGALELTCPLVSYYNLLNVASSPLTSIVQAKSALATIQHAQSENREDDPVSQESRRRLLSIAGKSVSENDFTCSLKCLGDFSCTFSSLYCENGLDYTSNTCNLSCYTSKSCGSMTVYSSPAGSKTDNSDNTEEEDDAIDETEDTSSDSTDTTISWGTSCSISCNAGDLCTCS